MLGIGFDINAVDPLMINMMDIINIENPMYSNYFHTDYKQDITAFLEKAYTQEIITDGCYIDLNPAAEEQEVRELVKQKVKQSIAFTRAIGSKQVVFLSTYLPMIGLESYDEKFVAQSVAFWKEILSEEEDITISLCNTFEYTPELLLRIREGVGDERFTLAIDLGHALAYGKIALDKFYKQMEPYADVVYIHSNDKERDEHLNVWQGKLLEDSGFKRIAHRLGYKKLIIKTLDKKHLVKNILVLRQNIKSLGCC